MKDEVIRRFPCVVCREIINDRAAECKYCGAPIDKGIAQAAAAVQDKVNQACSDASYLKIAAGSMWVLLGGSFLRLFSVFNVGFYITFVVVGFLLARWQLRFSNINTVDPDYTQARRAKNIAFAMWLAAILVGFVVKPLLSLLSARRF